MRLAYALAWIIGGAAVAVVVIVIATGSTANLVLPSGLVAVAAGSVGTLIVAFLLKIKPDSVVNHVTFDRAGRNITVEDLDDGRTYPYAFGTLEEARRAAHMACDPDADYLRGPSPDVIQVKALYTQIIGQIQGSAPNAELVAYLKNQTDTEVQVRWPGMTGSPRRILLTHDHGERLTRGLLTAQQLGLPRTLHLNSQTLELRVEVSLGDDPAPT